MELVQALIIHYAGRLFGAVVILIVGWVAISKGSAYMGSRMDRAGVDGSLKSFMVPLLRIGLQVLLVISVASMMGAEMTSFIAVIGAAAFAVGLALQGSLANFAGGVLILILRPFKIGDYIEAVGYAGTVKEIQVFHTLLNTPDNRRIIIPNAQLSNSSTVNYSSYDTRRLDLKFGIGYQDDLLKAKEVLRSIAEDHPLIMDDPAPMVVLGEHGDSALIIYYRVWCKASDYWSLYFELMEKVKLAFDEEGIQIPFPQRDVHLFTESVSD